MQFPSLRFGYVVILSLVFLLIPQPGSAQFHCLLCESEMDVVEMDAEHRFDSSGSMLRTCHDDNCHNNWRANTCTARHGGCEETKAGEVQEMLFKLLDLQDSPTFSAAVARLDSSTRFLSITEDGSELRLLSCEGRTVQAWALGVEGFAPIEL